MKYLVISDIHLAHRNTPTRHVIKNLYKYVLTKENSNIDVFFIAGDLYDRLISVESQENRDIMRFIGRLLDYCYKYKIKLRMLKGTPGHEYDQAKIIGVMNKQRVNQVDYKYFDILDIEHIVEFDKHVLYIPDEWSSDHKLIESQIKERMNELGIVNVDIAILHSMFNYQVAGIPYKGFRYDETYFLNLVKGYIIIGHVHDHSNFDRIIAGGGFDRYRHSEDGDKGYVVITGDEWEFKRNMNPFIYKTLRVTKNDDLTTLDRRISEYPKGSHIRLAISKEHPLNLDFKSLSMRYLDWNLTRKINEKTNNKRVIDILNEDSYSLDSFESLNSDIEKTLKEIILEKYTLTESAQRKLVGHLSIFKGSNKVEEDNV